MVSGGRVSVKAAGRATGLNPAVSRSGRSVWDPLQGHSFRAAGDEIGGCNWAELGRYSADRL